MKKLLSVALIGSLYAGTSYAQSSVTLYGLIDTSIAYANNQVTGGVGSPGHSNWSMDAGNVNNSRWGLRGSEDLGNGLSAVFTLENGFTSTNGKLGNGGDEFGRQAFAGLASKTYGTVTFGRQYDFIENFVTPLGGSGTGWGGNLAMHPYDNDDSITLQRTNNSVKYTSSTYRGLKFGAMYGFSNLAGQFSNNSVYSFGVSYANGPLALGAAFRQLNRSAGTANANATGAISTSDGDATITGGRQQLWGLSGRYTFGAASVGMAWTHSSTEDVTGVAQGGSITPLNGDGLTFDNFSIDGRYFLTSALSVAASYTYTDGRFSSATQTIRPKWNQLVVQTNYAFSKRTNVYLEGTYQSVSGGQGVPAFNASIFTLPQSSNSNQVVVALGLQHRF